MLLLQARPVEWAATIQMLDRRTVVVNAAFESAATVHTSFKLAPEPCFHITRNSPLIHSLDG
jgi:hypothetical protein